jgi:hypothetical protein
LASLYGTEVTYDKEGGGPRRDFVWIIGGDTHAHQKQDIIVNIHKDIQFRILVQKHKWKRQEYIDKAQAYRKGNATTEDLLGDCALVRPITRLRTGAQTPLAKEIFLRKEIGKGAFGIVTHHWNVSNGEQHAEKKALNTHRGIDFRRGKRRRIY